MAKSENVQELEGFLAECDVRIEATPDTVFEYFVDEQKILRWKGVKAELDPRPGGVFRVWVSPDWIASGEYVEVDPPRAVAFTWGWENNPDLIAPGRSLVRITLEPDAEGTVVSLRHSGLPNEEALASHSEGWNHFLARLAIAAAGGDPGPDPWATGGGA